MIDSHVHYLRPEWLQSLWSPDMRAAGFWARLTLQSHLLADEASLLHALDTREIEKAVIIPEISIAPGPQIPGGLTAALRLTQSMNTATAALVDRHPDRFLGLAVANPFGVGEDLAELRRAIVGLGLRGVVIGASYRGAMIDSAAARPFIALVDALDIPLVIHPSADGSQHHQRDFNADMLVGMPSDLAMAAVRLIVSGRLQEFPRLRVVLTHLGGSLLALLGWLDATATTTTPRVGIQVRRFYADTATATPAMLESAIETLGADHIMYGTDWPLLHPAHSHSPETDPIAMLDLTPSERRDIMVNTAVSLYGK